MCRSFSPRTVAVAHPIVGAVLQDGLSLPSPTKAPATQQALPMNMSEMLAVKLEKNSENDNDLKRAEEDQSLSQCKHAVETREETKDNGMHMTSSPTHHKDSEDEDRARELLIHLFCRKLREAASEEQQGRSKSISLRPSYSNSLKPVQIAAVIQRSHDIRHMHLQKAAATATRASSPAGMDILQLLNRRISARQNAVARP